MPFSTFFVNTWTQILFVNTNRIIQRKHTKNVKLKMEVQYDKTRLFRRKLRI